MPLHPTLTHLVEQYVDGLASKHRQYARLLLDKELYVAEAKTKKSPRSILWFDKGELVLCIGKPKEQMGVLYQTIYSPHCESLCLTPITTLKYFRL